jgi:hypothetical protein
MDDTKKMLTSIVDQGALKSKTKKNNSILILFLNQSMETNLFTALLLNGLLKEKQKESVTIERIEKAYDTYKESPNLMPGDLVVWKQGMSMTNMPGEGECAIVVKTYDIPLTVTSTQTATKKKKTYWRKLLAAPEPFTIALGVLDADGDFSIYHYNHRLFCHASQAPTNSADAIKRDSLIRYYKSFTTAPSRPFQVGDFVRLKEGMRNHPVPNYGDVVVVLDVFANPVTHANVKPNTSYFQEEYTMAVGVITGSAFRRFMAVGNRFELVKPATTTNSV